MDTIYTINKIKTLYKNYLYDYLSVLVFALIVLIVPIEFWFLILN